MAILSKKGGDDYQVTVAGPDGQFKVDVKDNGDGTYDGAYSVQKPGDYKVMVMVNKQKNPVGKSPYIAKIRAGADPKASSALGRGWDEAWDCIPAKFTIQARDPEGNLVPHELVKVIMKNVTTPQRKAEIAKDVEQMDPYLRKRKVGKAEKTIAERKKKALESKREAEAKGDKIPEIRIEEAGDVPVEVRDNGDGTYLAEYVAKDAGNYVIDVLIGPQGAHIKESPKQVPVHLSKPTVIFWKHTHAKQKEELESLRKRLQEAEASLGQYGMTIPQ